MSETKSLCQAGSTKRLLARRGTSVSSTPSPPPPASQAFTCAFHDKFLRQGSLYLQEGADVFRFRSPFLKAEVLIPFADIASIEKSRNLLIPNSITIKTGEREFFLTSFFSRDQAFDAAQKVFRQWHAETLLSRDKAAKSKTSAVVLKTTKLAKVDGSLQIPTTVEITARVGFNDDEGVGRVARSRSLHMPRLKQADSLTASKTTTTLITRSLKRLEKSMSSSTLVEGVSDVDSVHSVKQPSIAEARRSKSPLLEKNGYLLWLMIFMVSVFALASVSMIVFSLGTMRRVLTVVAEFETTVSPSRALA
ncbi:hypothetical protein BJ741DRAFT_573551 [Chytriomyces cf. hyalinus JEL632]|nr:hypothetical protein BJ741DRAFT_573551 [Chytriomyces cf. hyalinus JEL632]